MKRLALCLALVAAGGLRSVAASAAGTEAGPPIGVVLDAPGHAASEGAAVSASGGEPGAAWRIVDWRGRDTGLSGAFDADGRATLPPLPAGYWRMLGKQQADNGNEILATLASLSEGARSASAHVPPGRGAEGGPFAADTALSSISRRGAFLCPWNGGDTERTVAGLLSLAGFRHVRDRLHWRHVQPSGDAPPDFGRYLANAQMLRALGIGVSGMFHDSPAWALPAGRLPTDIPALYEFCRSAAAAFGDCMDDWEFWNEPDLAFAPEPVWDYAAAFKVAALGFRAGNPGVTVLNGALSLPPQSSPYHDALLANGAADYFDVFNYHTYVPVSKHAGTFRLVREKLAAAGAANKPVWVTEFGTELEGLPEKDGVMEGRKAHSPDQELIQAECCAKAQISFQMEGVERSFFFVFGAYDERGGRKDWGVIRRDGTVKPVFSALATMNRELGSARLLGALDAPTGIRAFLYAQPDGSQTVAFWSESPVDTARDGVVPAEPDYAREWRFAVPGMSHRGTEAQGEAKNPCASATPREETFRLVDMCGGVSTVAPDANGALALPATRFPSFLSGLGGLEPAIVPRSNAGFAEAAPSVQDLSIVLRIRPSREDFEISGRKTIAVVKGDAGRAAIEVWNFSDSVKTGVVEASGAAVSGLPAAPFAVPPYTEGPAVFDCEVSRESGAAAETPPDSALVLSGAFGGRPVSRLAMNLLFEKDFVATCERVGLPWGDPALWRRNSSGDAQGISVSGDAIRFDASWESAASDRWMYPVRDLAPGESLAGARRIEFDIRSEQDKVENDFKSQYVMLVYGDGRPDVFIPYDAPTGAWERRRVFLPPGLDTAAVRAIRIGANPRGTRCSLFVKDLAILK